MLTWLDFKDLQRHINICYEKGYNNNELLALKKRLYYGKINIYHPTDSVASYYTYRFVLMTQWRALRFQRLK